MKLSFSRFGLRLGSALGLIVALGAAAPDPQTSAANTVAADTVAADTVIAHKLTPQDASFREAPVPDEDAAAPTDPSSPSPTVSPKLLSPRTLYQGDGYSYASSEQTTLDGRRSPAAGLRLSLPVN